MTDFRRPDDPILEPKLWRMYRDFFVKAERKRRWSLERDIPWTECNKNLNPAIADVVESFCVVELYLPDYLIHAMPWSRPSRARTWFYANWGYEESKHSMALEAWLLRSGHCSEERMADLQGHIYDHPWQLPHDNVVAMLAYAMVQDRNLRRKTQELGGDPALEHLLMLLSVDEQSHHSFFKDAVRLYLELDRAGTLEQMRRVMHAFAMPALYGLADGMQRAARIRALEIFDDKAYLYEVYQPILNELGVQRSEMRTRVPNRKSAPTEVK
jgi:acyl-[acyl-carrier-protein] desaturase